MENRLTRSRYRSYTKRGYNGIYVGWGRESCARLGVLAYRRVLAASNRPRWAKGILKTLGLAAFNRARGRLRQPRDVLNHKAKRRRLGSVLAQQINRRDERFGSARQFRLFGEPRPTKVFGAAYPPSALRIFPPSGLPRPVAGSQPGPALKAPLSPETISWKADGF